MHYKYTKETSIGRITLGQSKKGLTHLWFEHEKPLEGYIECETPILKEAFKQLEAYLNHQRKAFDVPLDLKGTPFRERVWQALMQIPYGTTKTYKEVASMIGKPKACRAVGGANNKNPLPVIVPCHRVIGKDGTLVGYGGGLELKKKLLDHEGILYKNG